MTHVVIELDEAQDRILRHRAAEEKRTPQDLCREAVARYLGEITPEGPDRYESFRRMIGLVPDGPTDASVRHDHRPEDEPR